MYVKTYVFKRICVMQGLTARCCTIHVTPFAPLALAVSLSPCTPLSIPLSRALSCLLWHSCRSEEQDPRSITHMIQKTNETHTPQDSVTSHTCTWCHVMWAYVSAVMCAHLSCVTCHVSCHVSYVMSHDMSHDTTCHST